MDPGTELPWSVYDDVSVPQESWQRSIGDLRLVLFFTDRPGRLLVRWDGVSERVLDGDSSRRFQLHEVSEIVVGETVTAMLVFSGCRADAEGSCRLRGDYEIFDPDGVRVARFADVDIWDRKPAPPARSYQLSKGAAAIASAGGRPGRYRVVATVRDLNAGVETRLERAIELRATPVTSEPARRRFYARPQRR